MIHFGRFQRFFLNANRRTYGPTEGRTDGHMDGQILIYRCEDASKNVTTCHLLLRLAVGVAAVADSISLHLGLAQEEGQKQFM